MVGLTQMSEQWLPVYLQKDNTVDMGFPPAGFYIILFREPGQFSIQEQPSERLAIVRVKQDSYGRLVPVVGWPFSPACFEARTTGVDSLLVPTELFALTKNGLAANPGDTLVLRTSLPEMNMKAGFYSLHQHGYGVATLLDLGDHTSIESYKGSHPKKKATTITVDQQVLAQMTLLPKHQEE